MLNITRYLFGFVVLLAVSLTPTSCGDVIDTGRHTASLAADMPEAWDAPADAVSGVVIQAIVDVPAQK
jgi:hypothetical protein